MSKECNMSINDIDWFIPHQANQRIINAVSNKVKIPQEKLVQFLFTEIQSFLAGCSFKKR